MKKSSHKDRSFKWSLNPEIDKFTYDEIIELFLNRKTIDNPKQKHKLVIFKNHFEKAKKTSERMANEINNQGLASLKAYLFVYFEQNFDIIFEVSLKDFHSKNVMDSIYDYSCKIQEEVITNDFYLEFSYMPVGKCGLGSSSKMCEGYIYSFHKQ